MNLKKKFKRNKKKMKIQKKRNKENCLGNLNKIAAKVGISKTKQNVAKIRN